MKKILKQIERDLELKVIKEDIKKYLDYNTKIIDAMSKNNESLIDKLDKEQIILLEKILEEVK